MKFIYLFLAILLSTVLHSQNTEVDIRNGFKKIKLGSHISQFENLQSLYTNNYEKISIHMWKPDEEELKYLFDEKIDVFELHFDKNDRKLVMIKAHVIIDKPYVDPMVIKKYKEINDNFISVLGNPNKVSKKSYTTGWFGNKVAMLFKLSPNELKLDDNANTIGSTEFVLTFLEINRFNKKLDEGF